jgi:hypothetical protein
MHYLSVRNLKAIIQEELRYLNALISFLRGFPRIKLATRFIVWKTQSHLPIACSSYCTVAFAHSGISTTVATYRNRISVSWRNFKAYFAFFTSFLSRNDSRPSTKEVWTPLPISQIRNEFQNWFQTIRELVPKELNQMLSCVSNIKTLASLRDLAFTSLQVFFKFSCSIGVCTTQLSWPLFSS